MECFGFFAFAFAAFCFCFFCMAGKPFSPISPIPVKDLKIAVNLYNREMVSDAQMERYERLFDVLRRNGAGFSEITQPYSSYQRTIMTCEFKRDLEHYLSCASAGRKTLDRIIAFYQSSPEKMMRYGITTLLEASRKSVDDPDYKEAIRERAGMRRQITDELRDFDACIMTGPTNIMHFVGLPSLALRLCMGEDGIPRGIILYGADEDRLLAAALTIEAYCGPVLPPKLRA